MSELGSESRALVDAARRGLGPDELAIRRMRARVAATIAAGGTTAIASHAASAAATTTTAATTASGAALAVKVAVIAIAASTAIGTGVLVVRTRAAAPEPPVIELPASAPSRVLDRAELAPPAEVHVREAPPPAIVAAPPHPARVAVAAPISLARETELVDAALVALTHDRAGDALLVIRRYDAETQGHGQLAEDAASIEVEARCRLGDAHAAATFAAFEARWPEAPEHAKLAAVCAP